MSEETKPEEFKPSDVFFADVPLVGSMRKSELEYTAALLVRVMYLSGNTWRPLSWSDIEAALKHDLEKDVRPFSLWMRNPFVTVDFHMLGSSPYAVFKDEGGATIEFSPEGLAVLRRWVPRLANTERREIGT